MNPQVWTWNRKAVCQNQVDSKLKHLAILGHSWGLASSAPEGPHSQTAGSPRKIREIRFAAKVLRTTEVMELMFQDASTWASEGRGAQEQQGGGGGGGA